MIIFHLIHKKQDKNEDLDDTPTDTGVDTDGSPEDIQNGSKEEATHDETIDDTPEDIYDTDDTENTADDIYTPYIIQNDYSPDDSEDISDDIDATPNISDDIEYTPYINDNNFFKGNPFKGFDERQFKFLEKYSLKPIKHGDDDLNDHQAIKVFF